jgi:hypothetical protein
MKLVGPLYTRQNPAQSGGVAITVGTHVISPVVRRKKKGSSKSPVFGPVVAQEPSIVLVRAPHVNAPAPGLLPTARGAIGPPKPKPLTMEELMTAVLGPERETTVGKVVRK